MDGAVILTFQQVAIDSFDQISSRWWSSAKHPTVPQGKRLYSISGTGPHFGRCLCGVGIFVAHPKYLSTVYPDTKLAKIVF
jgi:hypothetical protein